MKEVEFQFLYLRDLHLRAIPVLVPALPRCCSISLVAASAALLLRVPASLRGMAFLYPRHPEIRGSITLIAALPGCVFRPLAPIDLAPRAATGHGPFNKWSERQDLNLPPPFDNQGVTSRDSQGDSQTLVTSLHERGEIEEFTAASRRRMLDYLAKVDDGAVPFMAGLTYPDEFDRYAWDGEQVKRHIDTLSKRFGRRFPDGCLMWKLEFQPRKSGVNKGKIAPHIHAFVWGVPWGFEWKTMRTEQVRLRRRMIGSVVVWDEGILAGGEWVEGHSALVDEREGWGAIRVEPHGKCPSVVNGDSIANWFARNWYDVVGSGEVKHYRAGTSVQTLGSKRGAFAYAAKKYVAKTGECVWSAKPGRFWGIVGRKNLPLGRRDVLELTNGQALKLRRVMRRYRMATCPNQKRAKMRKGQLFSRDFTVKLFAGVEFWMERIPALLGSSPRLRQAGARRLFPLLI